MIGVGITSPGYTRCTAKEIIERLQETLSIKRPPGIRSTLRLILKKKFDAKLSPSIDKFTRNLDKESIRYLLSKLNTVGDNLGDLKWETFLDFSRTALKGGNSGVLSLRVYTSNNSAVLRNVPMKVLNASVGDWRKLKDPFSLEVIPVWPIWYQSNLLKK